MKTAKLFHRIVAYTATILTTWATTLPSVCMAKEPKREVPASLNAAIEGVTDYFLAENLKAMAANVAHHVVPKGEVGSSAEVQRIYLDWLKVYSLARKYNAQHPEDMILSTQAVLKELYEFTKERFGWIQPEKSGEMQATKLWQSIQVMYEKLNVQTSQQLCSTNGSCR